MRLAEEILRLALRRRGTWSDCRELGVHVLGQAPDEDSRVLDGEPGHCRPEARTIDKCGLCIGGVEEGAHESKQVESNDGFVVAEQPFDEFRDKVGVRREAAGYGCRQSEELC